MRTDPLLPNPFSLSDTALAVLAIVTGVVVLLTALITLYITLASRKEVKESRKEVQQVHFLVNSEMTKKLDRITQLTEALVASNTAVPADPNEPGPSSPAVDF